MSKNYYKQFGIPDPIRPTKFYYHGEFRDIIPRKIGNFEYDYIDTSPDKSWMSGALDLFERRWASTPESDKRQCSKCGTKYYWPESLNNPAPGLCGRCMIRKGSEE